MKALFYLLDGESNASSWHRVLQYRALLRENEIEMLVSRPVAEAQYQRLVESGAKDTRTKMEFYARFLINRVRDVMQADRADVVVIQRDLFPFGPPVLERLLRRRNPRIVYDTDDATYVRPSFTPRTPFQRWRAWGKPAE